MVIRAASPSGGKVKHIYNVHVATDIGVHWLFEFGIAYRGLPATRVGWNHYRQTKGKRFLYQLGQAKNKTLVEDTMLRDKYWAGIVEWIRDYPTPLEQRKVRQKESVEQLQEGRIIATQMSR